VKHSWTPAATHQLERLLLLLVLKVLLWAQLVQAPALSQEPKGLPVQVCHHWPLRQMGLVMPLAAAAAAAALAA
jgi:hypothetical protein